MNSETHTTIYHNHSFKRQCWNGKTGTILCQGSWIRLSADFSLESWEVTRQQTDIWKLLKEKNVNQEFYIQQNCPSKVRKKLRLFQTNKSWGSPWPLGLPCTGNVQGGTARWKERTLHSNSIHEHSEKGNYKVSFIIALKRILRNWFS